MKSNIYMRKYSFLLISLFFMQFIAPLPAGSSDLVKVGVYQNTPFTFIEENGNIKGFFIDILEHIAIKKGWEIEYVPSSFPECLSNLKNGNIDLLGAIAYSKTRGRNFDYTYENVITNWGQIYLNKKSDIESIIDLKGKKVAVLQNDIYFDNLRKLVSQFGIQCRFIEAFEYEDVLELVEIGRCEAGLVSQIYGLQRERNYDIVKSSILLSPQKLYWAAPKGKNQELLHTLDSYFRELKDNHQSIYYEALAKWFGVGETPKFGKWFKWVISSSVVLFILFFTLSLILRVQVKSKTNELLIKNEELKKEIKYRKEAEEELQKLASVIKYSSELVNLATLDGKMIFLNESGSKMLGIDLDEVERINIMEVIPDHMKELVQNELLPALIQGLTWEGELQYRNIKTGDLIDVYARTFTVREPKTRKALFLANVSMDITDRKLAEEERRNMEAQLQQTQKMESIGTLAGGIAHDFNNILGIIIGNTELAMDDISKRDRTHFNLEEIRVASQRAKDVVKQLLSFARKTKLKQKPIKLIPVVKDSIKLLRAIIPVNIDIRQNITDISDIIFADPTQIHQVMINLCTNASHAMQETGGILGIEIENVLFEEDSDAVHPDLTPGTYVKLTVSDTGQGMNPELKDRIFDPYFTTKEVGKGTGLGLSVVHGIVKKYGGTISVESELEKGTTFYIYFPVIEEEAVIETKTVEELPTGNERILLVDDEKSIIYVGRYRLERLGYQVETKTNPVEALELFRTNPDQFDLVITDMAMPQMTGVQMIKEILKIRPDTPTILCTGFSEKIDEKKAKEIGATEYIEKPIGKQDFAFIVRKVLDRE